MRSQSAHAKRSRSDAHAARARAGAGERRRQSVASAPAPPPTLGVPHQTEARRRARALIESGERRTSRSAGPGGEGAEVRERDVVASRERLADGGEHAGDHGTGGVLGQGNLIGDKRRELRLVHGAGLAVCLACSVIVDRCGTHEAIRVGSDR